MGHFLHTSPARPPAPPPLAPTVAQVTAAYAALHTRLTMMWRLPWRNSMEVWWRLLLQDAPLPAYKQKQPSAHRPSSPVLLVEQVRCRSSGHAHRRSSFALPPPAPTVVQVTVACAALPARLNMMWRLPWRNSMKEVWWRLLLQDAPMPAPKQMRPRARRPAPPAFLPPLPLQAVMQLQPLPRKQPRQHLQQPQQSLQQQQPSQQQQQQE